jgi:hypothetical protein
MPGVPLAELPLHALNETAHTTADAKMARVLFIVNVSL